MSKKKYKSSNSRKRKQRNQKTTSFALILGGVAIIAIALLSAFNGGGTETEIIYEPEDVVYDAPLFVIHEMTPPTLSSIQFYPKDGPQPEITISESFHDFGSIGPTDVVTHDFVIANHGDAPLTIHRAYTTCGCTTAEFTSTIIPPGKVVIMTLILDAGFHDVSGQTVRRGVIIENNDPNNSQIEIWSEGSVRNSP
jgi:hypothetical protein